MPQRNWLITGVSSGFGRVMTEQLLACGDCVAGTVRDLSVMDGLKAEHGDLLWLAELDLSETASIRVVVDHAWTALCAELKENFNVFVGKALRAGFTGTQGLGRVGAGQSRHAAARSFDVSASCGIKLMRQFETTE
jgi:NAD(P)-dependent dehydrogenase (short-subunit alcohol dehydrogenase family)